MNVLGTCGDRDHHGRRLIDAAAALVTDLRAGIAAAPTILLLSAVAMLLQLSPELQSLLELRFADLICGSLWRLASSHLLHWSWNHCLWDAVVFLAAGGMCESRWPGACRRVLFWSAGLIPLVVMVVAPELQCYRGLSGGFRTVRAGCRHAAAGRVAQWPADDGVRGGTGGPLPVPEDRGRDSGRTDSVCQRSNICPGADGSSDWGAGGQSGRSVLCRRHSQSQRNRFSSVGIRCFSTRSRSRSQQIRNSMDSRNAGHHDSACPQYADGSPVLHRPYSHRGQTCTTWCST